MKKAIVFSVLSILLFTGSAFCENKLLQEADITYLGGFTVPKPWLGSVKYHLGAGALSMAYNPNNDSLIVSGMPWHNMVTEITIPDLVNSSNLANLNRAAFVTPHPHFFDPTDGNRSNIGTDGEFLSGSVENRGLLVYGDRLIGTTNLFYDAGGNQKLSHFTNSLDLLANGEGYQDFQGHFELDAQLGAGVLAGPMCEIPAEYQEALGGKVMTGMGFGSIVTSTSYGPSVTVFDPDDLGSVSPVPANTLLAYHGPGQAMFGDPDTYYYLTNNQPANPYTSPSDRVGGIAFPSGTRTILFFGIHGNSDFDGYACYGHGTSDPDEAYTEGPPYLFENRIPGICYDPSSSQKGNHSWTMSNQIWAYDVDELIEVKNSNKNYWEPVPYAVWQPELPTSGGQIFSAAYDPATRRIFVAQRSAEEGNIPVMHVFQVAGEPTEPSSLQPPQNLKVKK